MAPTWTTPCSGSSRPMGQWGARTTPRPRSRPFPRPPRRSRGCRPLLPQAPCRTPPAWFWPPFRSKGPRPRRGPLSSPIWWSSSQGWGPQPSWLARLRRPPRAPFPPARHPREGTRRRGACSRGWEPWPPRDPPRGWLPPGWGSRLPGRSPPGSPLRWGLSLGLRRLRQRPHSPPCCLQGGPHRGRRRPQAGWS